MLMAVARSQAPRSDALEINSLSLLAKGSMSKHMTKCKELGDYCCFVIRHPRSNIWSVGPSLVTFTHERKLPKIPQTPEDIAFGQEELLEGSRIGTYQQVSAEYGQEEMEGGAIISSAFVTRQNGKTRLVINLKEQS